MIYEFDSRIRYSEVNKEGELIPWRADQLFSGLQPVSVGASGAWRCPSERKTSGMAAFFLAGGDLQKAHVW